MRRSLVAVVAVLAGLVVPGVASAAPPEPSAISVSPGEVSPGGTFSVAFEVYNPQAFTVTSAGATLLVQEVPITDVFELVSCTGSTSPCSELSPTAFRGPVGDLAPQQEALVTFTFRVKETTPLGSYTLQHVLLGSNFSFALGTGPAVTVTATPSVADLAVSLDASPRGVLTSRVTYTVSVANLGPADASAIRIAGSYPAGLSWSGGSGCVRDGGRNVVCDFSSIPVGGVATASYSVNVGLLALGSFSSTVARASSSPSDPDSGNDSARRSCTALTGLLVRC